MPKKIADIKRKSPTPKTAKEKIVEFLGQHSDEGFNYLELGQAIGFIPKLDSFGTLAGFLIGSALGNAGNSKSTDAIFRDALNELVNEGVVEHDDKHLYFWLREETTE